MMNHRFPNSISSLYIHLAGCWLLLVFTAFLLLPMAAVAQQSAAIHEAAKAGDQEQLTEILDADKEAWKLADKAGNQALHLAAWNGHAEAVKLLLDRGAEVDARGFDDWTALHFAASRDHAAVCQLLLENGADREALNGVSRSPLQMAGAESRRVIGKFQVRMAGAEAFVAAAIAGNLEEVGSLLDKSPPLLNARAKGLSALMAAAGNNRLDVMRLLIERGADINLLSDATDPEIHGASALSLACDSGHLEAVRLLLAHDVEVNPADVKATASAAILAQQPLQKASTMAVFDFSKALASSADGEAIAALLGPGGIEKIADFEEDEKIRTLRSIQNIIAKSRVSLPRETREAKRQIIALLLEAGAEPNRVTSFGTPLNAAIFSEDVEVTRLLLESGAAPDTEFSTISPMTPIAGALLIPASESKSLEMVELLLEAGADPTAESDGYSGLSVAAGTENVAAFHQMLAHLDPETLPAVRQSALLGSIAERPTWLKEALDAGFDVNAQDSRQMTVLHRTFVNIDSLRLVLSAGADPNLKDFAGFTPLHNAAEDGHPEYIPLLLAHSADIEARTQNGATPLGTAASAGDFKSAELLLEAGANPNVANKFGVTPLLAAAGSGNLETVQLLLDSGADIDHLGEKSGYSALMVAAGGVGYFNHLQAQDKPQEGFLNHPPKESNEPYLQIVKYLIAHGADVNLRGKPYGATALQFAAAHSTTEMVKLLLESGAGLEMTSLESRNTPLYAAITEGNLETFQLLLELGANIHTKGDFDRTPLGVAAGSSRNAMIKILLKKGADIEARDQSGVTPLFQAVFTGSDEAIRCLLEHGADVEAEAGDGKTPIDIATLRENSSLVRLLNRYRK